MMQDERFMTLRHGARDAIEIAAAVYSSAALRLQMNGAPPSIKNICCIFVSIHTWRTEQSDVR